MGVSFEYFTALNLLNSDWPHNPFILFLAKFGFDDWPHTPHSWSKQQFLLVSISNPSNANRSRHKKGEKVTIQLASCVYSHTAMVCWVCWGACC